MDVQAVDQTDIKTLVPEHGCYGEKAQRFGPHIVCGEIVYPWIYQNQRWGHVFYRGKRNFLNDEPAVEYPVEKKTGLIRVVLPGVISNVKEAQNS